jgi:hypothetical protein
MAIDNLYISHQNFDWSKFAHIDLGDDNCHPGPLTHKWYAESLFELITNNGH